MIASVGTPKELSTADGTADTVGEGAGAAETKEAAAAMIAVVENFIFFLNGRLKL